MLPSRYRERSAYPLPPTSVSNSLRPEVDVKRLPCRALTALASLSAMLFAADCRTDDSPSGPAAVVIRPRCISCGVSVTPDGGRLNVAPNSSGNDATFTVKNLDPTSHTYTLSCSSTGNITCTQMIPSQVTLPGGQQIDVDAIFSAGAVGSGTVSVTASGPGGPDDGSYNVTIH